MSASQILLGIALTVGLAVSAPLVALGIAGEDKLLPATVLVIVGTVAIHGLSASPSRKTLRLRERGAGPDH